MDERLINLCKMCNIYLDGELTEIGDAVEEWGIAVVLSSMKLLSMSTKLRGKYPIEQFRDILSEKIRQEKQAELIQAEQREQMSPPTRLEELFVRLVEEGKLSADGYDDVMATLEKLKE